MSGFHLLVEMLWEDFIFYLCLAPLCANNGVDDQLGQLPQLKKTLVSLKLSSKSIHFTWMIRWRLSWWRLFQFKTGKGFFELEKNAILSIQTIPGTRRYFMFCFFYREISATMFTMSFI